MTFEVESTQARTQQRGTSDQTLTAEHSTASLRSDPDPRAGSDSAHVESVPHLVEHRENFWTISRLYYNSGRYHRALWKANSGRYPDIEVLHVGDMIMVPPVEDLDQDFILPPRTRASSNFAGPERSPGSGGNRQDDATDLAGPSAPPSSQRRSTSIRAQPRPPDQPMVYHRAARAQPTPRSICR